MSTALLVCAFAGSAVLLLQFLLGLVGLDHGDLFGVDLSDLHAGDALNLLSVRAIGAGLAFFGLVGLLVLSWGGPEWMALPAGLVAGGTAATLVAFATQQLRRLESDGTLRLEKAVGEAATVYLSIPGELAGSGKVHLALQGRTVELEAVSQHALATGTPVVVVDLVGPDTVEVAPQLPPEV
ncbi:MAG TPA: hypothetical protein VEW03_05705 [Longimicrobiaceae bacterium]|nr:hypothetical protein [Longimicrobiaceae bacterium]